MTNLTITKAILGCISLSIALGTGNCLVQEATETTAKPKPAVKKPAEFATSSQRPIDETKPAKDLPLERARRETLLLDDMYKTAIVLITEHYVHDSDDLPAGEAFNLMFDGMQEKGWHEVRLIDASGEPINDENEANPGFEKRGVKQLLGGKPLHDEVVTEKGKRFLRTVTAIPVVLDKCVMCHDNYADVPKGQAIGAIGFKVPIDDGDEPAKSK